MSIEVILDNLNDSGCFSVRKWEYVENESGNCNYIGEPERRAFCPGQLEELRDYAPELVERATSIWTPEIIAAWKQKQAEIISK